MYVVNSTAYLLNYFTRTYICSTQAIFVSFYVTLKFNFFECLEFTKIKLFNHV